MVLYAQDIAQRYPTITTLALHPDAINTGLIKDKPTLDRWFLKLVTLGKTVPLSQGVWNTCWPVACTSQLVCPWMSRRIRIALN